jgi:hypothetical protein
MPSDISSPTTTAHKRFVGVPSQPCSPYSRAARRHSLVKQLGWGLGLLSLVVLICLHAVADEAEDLRTGGVARTMLERAVEEPERTKDGFLKVSFLPFR